LRHDSGRQALGKSLNCTKVLARIRNGRTVEWINPVGGTTMTPDEQHLISSLFERLKKADTAPKDPEAEQLIREKVTEAPSAPYLLAQSVLVQ
jgi:hypothetical protein